MFVFTDDNRIEHTDDYPYALGENRRFVTEYCDGVELP